jgi:hypothetical protein
MRIRSPESSPPWVRRMHRSGLHFEKNIQEMAEEGLNPWPGLAHSSSSAEMRQAVHDRRLEYRGLSADQSEESR